ncbi:TPA: lipopolysaccharide biosynthesis protein [Streptococcus suis]
MNKIQKNIYFWNLLGNLVAAGVSVFYLLIVSRFSTAQTADDFSMAYAIGNLWVVIGLFQVRNYQGTDVKGTHSFPAYFLARCYSLLFMVVSILPFLQLTSYQSSYLLVFLLLAYRISDVVSDLYQGLFQQEGRLDIAGQNMTFRYTTSILLLAGCLAISQNLAFSLAGLAIWNGLVVLLLDVKKGANFSTLRGTNFFSPLLHKEAWGILQACLPLFINGFLLTYIFNEPKQVIEQGLANGSLTAGMQRDFSILFMPVFFMSLCVLIVRPLITELAKLWHQKNTIEFASICRKLFLSLFLIGSLASLMAYWIGIPVLSLLYGVNLSSYAATLAILVFAGILYSLSIVCENILTIFRKQQVMVLIYLCLFALSKWLTGPLITSYQLWGAAISFLITMFVYLLLMSFLTFYYYHKGKKHV